MNQHQLTALLHRNDVVLYHEDAPLLSNMWSSTSCGAGFPTDEQNAINAIPDRDARSVDWTYEIAFPFFSFRRSSSEPVAHFMVTNFGITKRDFPGNASDDSMRLQDGDLIITPSRWSRNKICQYGFPEDRVRVVHHGVDPKAFYPLSPDERALMRKAIGLKTEEFCFLNVGALSVNKGLDLLIKAFAKVASIRPDVRLLIKDQGYLYGATAQEVIQGIFSQMSPYEADLVASKTIAVGSNLSVEQLRLLYGAADCYVSPYRAEGFNLPVLEAMACGTPVLVTDGGATDDFVFSSECKISSRQTHNRHLDTLGVTDERLLIDTHFLEPDFDGLITTMVESVDRRFTRCATNDVINRFGWAKVTDELLATLRK